jgi:hypothetical protein
MEASAFARHLAPLRHVEWNVYAKRPFGGPQQVLEYLGRYTHRVAIANSRLLGCENGCVRFRWKDYRADNKSKVMTLDADESSAASCCTCCRKDFAAFGTSGSWRTHAAPSFQPSALPCKRPSRPRPSNPPIIASATQSSPAIASIYARSAEAAWSRSAFGRARHHRSAPRRDTS